MPPPATGRTRAVQWFAPKNGARTCVSRRWRIGQEKEVRAGVGRVGM
jgi:hypothetical protein